MKTAGLFYFADEPQYATATCRAYLAHLLRSYRNASHITVTRTGCGRYLVKRSGPQSPVAVIVTH